MTPSQHEELEHLADLCGKVNDLRAQIAEQVDRARAEGASWADIGHALNMSKQGAQKRFGKAS